jgi:DNA helicase-2/ATP-dependent DNA helicase PcrA
MDNSATINIEKNKPCPQGTQLECVNKLDGKLLILAGPGTGKTFTLIHRIKNIIKSGVHPEKILCLTFSDAAATEMRTRIEEELNNHNCGINVYTYHAYCNDIISEYVEDFGLNENYKVIPDSVSREIIKECIDEYEAKEYRNNKNNPYVYISTILKKIAEIKHYRLNESEYLKNIKTNPDYEPALANLKVEIQELKNSDENKNAKIIEKKVTQMENIQKEIAKAKEILDYYNLYQEKLAKNNFIDFNDMINLVLEKFEQNPTFLDKIANKYEHILVDEYQDTNKSQNDLIFMLTHALKTQNICVVGDDDQIIYSFQGANMETIEGFLREFPDTTVKCLTENRRSTQSILNAAQLIANQDERRLVNNRAFKTPYNINKNLVAKNEKIILKDKPVRLSVYENSEQEEFGIVDEIENLINSQDFPKTKEGKPNYAELAIIVTSHDAAKIYEDLLKQKNIPTQRAKNKSIFEINSSITLFYYMQMLSNPELYCDKLLKLLLSPPFEINPVDFTKILDGISKDKSFIETIKEIKTWTDKEKIEKFITAYDNLNEYKNNETTKNIVLEIMAQTKILDYFANTEINRTENIAALKKIVQEAGEFYDNFQKPCFEEFVEYLLMIQNDNELDIEIDSPPVTLNAVQILTYHGSKGREFDYVYLPSLQASKWNSSSRPSLKPIIPTGASEYKTDEERKILRQADRVKNLYVGMTRARHSLSLSYNKASKPCKWIDDIKDTLEVTTKPEISADDYTNLQLNSIKTRKYDYKRDFAEQISKILASKIYSASSINRYLKCPRMFLYGDILKLDARFGIADAANYGTAIHEACRFMVEKGQEQNFYPQKEDFINTFKKELHKLSFSTPEIEKYMKEEGKTS